MPLDRAFTDLGTKAGAHFDRIYVYAFLAIRLRIDAALKHDNAVDQATASQALLAR